MTQASELIQQQLMNALGIYAVWGDIVINVKDKPFNAKGDGVTDDTIAIQGAIDYAISIGKHEVTFPTGTYKYGTLFNTSGITFVGDGVTLDGTTLITLVSFATLKADVAQRAINPMAAPYNAVGNGIANDTVAMQAAYDAAISAGSGTVILPFGSSFKISSVTIRSNTPITTIGYGAKFIPTDNANPMLEVYGSRHKFIGFKVEPATNDTFTAIKVMVDATTTDSSKCEFIDLNMQNVYRGIHIYMAAAIGTTYRHTIQNCTIENYYLPKTWSGSFGIGFDGDTAGNSSGNDSKVFGGLVKGYESNIVVRKSVGTKLFGISLDGGANAVYYDGGSLLDMIGCYCEYNDYVFNLVNSPSRLNFFFGSIAHTGIASSTGTLLNSDPINFFTAGAEQSDLFFALGYILKNIGSGITQVGGSNRVRMFEDSFDNYVDFRRVSSSLAGFDFGGLQTGYNGVIQLPTGKTLSIGGTVFAVFDDNGNITLTTGRRCFALLRADNRSADLAGGSSSPGDILYRTDTNRFRVRENTTWNTIQTNRSGTTANRPSSPEIGLVYFDTTLGKPVWYNGSNWVDATGTTV